MLLDPSSHTDLSIHGGSIAGLTLALLAARSGRSTALVAPELADLDSATPTPAIATVQQEFQHHHIWRWAGERAVTVYAEQTRAAVDLVAELAGEIGVAVRPVTMATMTTAGNEAFWLRHEAHAMRLAGVPVDFDDKQRMPFATRPAMISPDQLLLDSNSYRTALLAAFQAAGGAVVDSPVPARRLVSATPKPVLDRYAMNPRLQQHTWRWHHLKNNPGGSTDVCSLIDDGGRLVLPGPKGGLLIGSRRDDGREWVARHWPQNPIVASWQVPTSAAFDGLPFIGAAGPGRDHEYVACGFDVWELTSGTIAASELHRLIVGGDPVQRVFSPSRRPRAAAVFRAAWGAARFGMKISTVTPFPKAPLR